MPETHKFTFNGKVYYIGTIVKINEEYQKHTGFNSFLKFIGYNASSQTYCFSSLVNNWDIYNLFDEQINLYIDKVIKEEEKYCEKTECNPKYIDGILSAWIWYILFMFGALFLNGRLNIIIVWCLSTLIFFSWRSKKIKGG